MLDESAFARMQSNPAEQRARLSGETLERVRERRCALRRPISGGPVAPELTSREIAILRLVAVGHDNASIARTLHYGLGTIKLHVREILQKLDAGNRTEAAVKAVRLGLI